MHREEVINETACHAELANLLRDFDQHFSFEVVRGDLATISLTLANLSKQPECSQAERELYYSQMVLLYHLQPLIEKIEKELHPE